MTDGPLLVTGTPGSGSEFAAHCLAAVGVCFASGTRESAAGKDGETDERVARLSESILRDGCPAADPGLPDWGWTETEAFDAGTLERHRKAALALFGEYRNSTGFWALHEPLAVPLLDFWEDLLGPSARFVLVYRESCVSTATLLCRWPERLWARADYAVRLWCHHNRLLLDFHSRHPGRCLLVNGDAVGADPVGFATLLVGRLASDLGSADPDGFARLKTAAPGGDATGEQTGGESLLRAMLPRLWPDCNDLYASLEQAAELPCPLGSCAPSVPDERARKPHERRSSIDLSVVVTCFNDGEYLAEAVDSALATCAGRSELIVVDDGSDDLRTRQELERLRETGIHVIVRPQPSGGPGLPRNVGIEASRGRYVLPLDADDRLHPSWGQLGITALDADSRLGVVYGDAIYFGAWKGRWTMGRFDLARLLERNFIASCAVIRREVWEEVGGYDPAFSPVMWEDYDMWLSVAERGWAFGYLPEVLFDYRIRRTSGARDASRQSQRAAFRGLLEVKHPALFRQGFAPALGAWHEWVQATTPPPPGGPHRWSGAVPSLVRQSPWRRYQRVLGRHARHPVMATKLVRLELRVMAGEARDHVRVKRSGR